MQKQKTPFGGVIILKKEAALSGLWERHQKMFSGRARIELSLSSKLRPLTTKQRKEGSAANPDPLGGTLRDRPSTMKKGNIRNLSFY